MDLTLAHHQDASSQLCPTCGERRVRSVWYELKVQWWSVKFCTWCDFVPGGGPPLPLALGVGA